MKSWRDMETRFEVHGITLARTSRDVLQRVSSEYIFTVEVLPLRSRDLSSLSDGRHQVLVN